MACRNFQEASARVPRESIAWECQTDRVDRRGKWEGFCCPVPSRNRAYVRCLGGSSECNVVIVGTCEWPVTAEPYRAKTAPLPRSSILFRPHRPRSAERRRMVEAPGTAPGSDTL